MGSGLAEVAAKAGYDVVVRSRSKATADAMISSIEKGLDKQVSREKITADDKAAILGRLSATEKIADLADCDLVIESVVEDLAVKTALFAELDKAVKPGAILATVGLVSLVYGITQAESVGWTGTTTLSFIGVGLVLLAIFLVVETKTSHPLLPLRILANRNRGGAYLASFFVGIGLFAMFLFLTYFFQAVLGYTPLQSGLLFLPFSAGVIVSAALASQLLPRFGPRWVTASGFLLAIIGMVLLTTMSPSSAYVSGILPSLIIISLGMGLVFVPLSAVSLFAIGNHDAGVASAVLNTSQQIGGSIGVAFLNTVAASATTAYIVANNLQGPTPDALVAGFTRGFGYGAAILAVAGLIWVILVNMSKKDMAANDSPTAHVG